MEMVNPEVLGSYQGRPLGNVVNTSVASGNQRFHHAAKQPYDAAGKSTAPGSVTLVG